MRSRLRPCLRRSRSAWRIGRSSSRRLGMVEAVAAAVDELLDGEQRDQERRRAESRHRARQSACPTAGGSCRSRAEIVDVAEPDQAQRDAEHHEADDDLDDQPRRAVHRLRDRGQVEMIVAAGRDRRADEDRVDEQRRGDLLQPQPGMADGARDDVARRPRARSRSSSTPQRIIRISLEPVERRAISDDAAAAAPVCRRWHRRLSVVSVVREAGTTGVVSKRSSPTEPRRMGPAFAGTTCCTQPN